MRRSEAVQKINAIICDSAKGLFSDECWEGISIARKSLEAISHELELFCVLNNTKYETAEGDLTPTRKRWVYVAEGYGWKEPIIILIMACGAGTVSDPLSKYDVISYAM